MEWEQIQAACGPATEVPALLAALRSARKAERATAFEKLNTFTLRWSHRREEIGGRRT